MGMLDFLNDCFSYEVGVWIFFQSMTAQRHIAAVIPSPLHNGIKSLFVIGRYGNFELER
jgi:hypothetical protein